MINYNSNCNFYLIMFSSRIKSKQTIESKWLLVSNLILWLSIWVPDLVHANLLNNYRTTYWDINGSTEMHETSTTKSFDLLICLDNQVKTLFEFINTTSSSESAYGPTLEEPENGLKSLNVALTKQIVIMIDQMEVTVQSNVRSIDNLMKTRHHLMNRNLMRSLESRLRSVEDHLSKIHHRLRLMQAVNLILLNTTTESSAPVTSMDDSVSMETDQFSKPYFFIQLRDRVNKMASEISKLKGRVISSLKAIDDQ